ncbi:MAG: hypothetical protein CMH57_12330 [Myxococcales bacterium]|nr:hypothetical protein [Myxococcales bacterium]
MKILIISYYFPPFNVIGAVRVGKLAHYLHTFGHDVQVISAADQPLQATLTPQLPEERVTHTPWIDVNRLVQAALGGREKVARQGYATSGGSPTVKALLGRLGLLYKTVLHTPDGQIGWLPWAIQASLQKIEAWGTPDIIFASSSPLTSLIAARVVSQRSGVPWVADMRDMWTTNPYYPYKGLRKRFDRWLETELLQHARGMTGVSAPIVEELRAEYGKPAQLILNGFDLSDYPTPAPPDPDGPLRIVYTGMIYEGRRDPTPLFQALKLLGERAERVRVAFYGRYLNIVHELAERCGVPSLVEVHDPVPYSESLRLQAEADLLLLLLWNDPRAQGVFTGKLFEYIGAGRPIIALGAPDNVAARLVADRGAGVVPASPQELAEQLDRWITLKEQGQLIPSPDNSVRAGLSREDQARRLADFLSDLTSN